ncbi:hypothetical protein ABPG72_002379 [Tetrahymena utriculariae]
MREIIQIGVGQCGIKISEKYWEIVSNEVDIASNGTKKQQEDEQYDKISLDVHYEEVKEDVFRARACFLDLESHVIDQISNGAYRDLFSDSLFASPIQSSTKNIYAIGKYSLGELIHQEVTDFIVHQMEKCESIDSFQLVHSLCGGTGSGLGCLILDEIFNIQNGCQLMVSFPQFPRQDVSSNLLEIYNTVLSLDTIIEFADMAIPFDNQKLISVCEQQTCYIEEIQFSHLNYLVAHSISGLSAGIRFPGQLNISTRKLATNLIPFRRYSFLLNQLYPLSGKNFNHASSFTERELVDCFWRLDNTFLSNIEEQEKFMTLYGLFRGRNISTGEVEQSVSQLLMNKRKNKEFSEWIESSISLAYCNTPPKGAINSVQILSNYAGIHRVFTDLVNKFRQQFTRKSYLHYYLQEGMEEFQFSEALSNLTETCFEYNQYSQDVLFNQDDSSVEE